MSIQTPFDDYKQYLLPKYEPFPQGKYVSLLILRKTESETLFRTEGNEGDVVKELTRNGLKDDAIISRVVMTKRKQTAVERRTGREILRRFGLLTFNDNKGNAVECALNRNKPCERCIDCFTYGYAVGGGGAQKSRVMTSDAFSLLSAQDTTARRTINSTFDDGTMRDPETKRPSAAFVPDVEYVKPEVHFVDLQTLKDVTPIEMTYVVGNVLRSTRYGAVSSRIGRMKNIILTIAFSTMEGPSSLELVQDVTDRLKEKLGKNFPSEQTIADAVLESFENQIKALPSDFASVKGNELKTRFEALNKLYQDEEGLKILLEVQTKAYQKL